MASKRSSSLTLVGALAATAVLAGSATAHAQERVSPLEVTFTISEDRAVTGTLTNNTDYDFEYCNVAVANAALVSDLEDHYDSGGGPGDYDAALQAALQAEVIAGRATGADLTISAGQTIEWTARDLLSSADFAAGSMAYCQSEDAGLITTFAYDTGDEDGEIDEGLAPGSLDLFGSLSS